MNLNPDDKVIKAWSELKMGETVQLSSSGSSSSNRFYNFGPIDGVLEVEKVLKNSPLIMLQMHKGDNGFYTIKNRKYSALFAFNPLNYDFSKLWEKEGYLCAAPNVWLFLSKCKKFLSGVSRFKSLSTTGWEPFFDSSLFPVHVNDNMLNLKTGDAFYTCPFNSVHCFPFKLKIGDKVANLMNLGDKTLHVDDDEIIWEYRSCLCGSRLPICISRNCHLKNTFRPIMDLCRLQGHYRNWQAIKSSSGVNLFLSGDYPLEDFDFIQSCLGECKIYSGMRYKTGINKWASFWSGEIDPFLIEEF